MIPAIVAKLGFGLVFGGLKKRLVKAWRWMTKNPARMLAVALLLVLAWGLWERSGKHDALDKVAAGKEAYRLQAVAYEAAQAAAAAAQAAFDFRSLEGQITRNKGLVNAHNALEQARRLAVADYARTHRVRPEATGASCGAPSGTSEAGMHGDPRPPADPADTTELLAIRSDEFEQLTKAAMHGAETTRFLNTLVDEGRAIRESDLPEVWR